MKTNIPFLAGLLLALGVALSASAQPERPRATVGAEKPIREFTRIEVKNFQDETLGRLTELGVDLINGRIVEVLVICDRSLEVGAKIVAVPPLALVRDPLDEIFRLDVSTEAFKSAPAIDLAKWTDANRSDRVAAAYRHFGQEPYFLEEGDTANKTAQRPKVSLGYVERSSKILDLPVGNLQGEPFGKVWSLSLNITRGEILSIIVLAPGNWKTKTIVPATALSFNPARDALLLDQTKLEYADEPRYIFTEAAFGQDAYSREESYQGPHTFVALEQGVSYRDVDLTVRINKDMREAKIDRRHVQVGTLNGRVTLRGWVDTSTDKRRIADIAAAASRLEVVDNQIAVGPPTAAE